MRKLMFRTERYTGTAVRKSTREKSYISAVIVTAASSAMVFPAYADGLTVTDAAIKTMLNSTIDVIFLIFSVGIRVPQSLAFFIRIAVILFIQQSIPDTPR